MARQQVPDLPQRGIQPAAGPVQRYAIPERPTAQVGPSKAQQVAQALSQFAPHLFQFAQNNQTREDQEAIAQAKLDRTKNVMTFVDAQKKGLIRPDQNPWYMKTWKQLDGNSAADQYYRDLLAATYNGPLANSTDQEQSKGLIDNFRDNWIKQYGVAGTDRDFLTGFHTKANGYESNVRTAQVQRVAGNIQQDFIDKFGQNVSGIIDEAAAFGLDAQGIADGINQKADEAIKVAGVDPKIVNATILTAATTKAKHTLNIQQFDDVLAKVRTGSGFLGNTTNAKKVREELVTAIANELHQRDMWARNENEYKRKETAMTAKVAIGDVLQKNLEQGKPTTFDDIRPFMEALNTVAPDEHEQMMKAVMASRDWPDAFENDPVKQNLYVETFAGRSFSPKKLTAALINHDISLKTWTELTKAQYQIQEDAENRARRQADRTAKEIELKFMAYKIEPFKKGEIEVMQAFTQDPYKGFNIGLALQEGQAKDLYWNLITDFFAKNQDASVDEYNNFKAHAVEQAINSYHPSINAVGGVRSMLQKTAPGVKNKTAPIFPTEPEPMFKKPEEFGAALDEYNANPNNPGSKIAILSKQRGQTPLQFLQEQMQFFQTKPTQ